jgi:hypothetical protein
MFRNIDNASCSNCDELSEEESEAEAEEGLESEAEEEKEKESTETNDALYIDSSLDEQPEEKPTK